MLMSLVVVIGGVRSRPVCECAGLRCGRMTGSVPVGAWSIDGQARAHMYGSTISLDFIFISAGISQVSA
jgi:hypothetical protein